jgi:hypothetical protein
MLSSTERSAMDRLSKARITRDQSMTDGDTMVLKQLEDKQSRLSGCQIGLVFRQRDALAAP